MKQLLITTSLISKTEFYRSASGKWKDKSEKELTDMLNRVYSKPGPEAQQGINFENALQREAQNPTGKGSAHFQEMAEACKGGQWQVKTKKIITLSGQEYCLFGKIDVKKDGLLIDIKTTAYFKPEKYLSSTQHLLYCYNENISQFEYIVAEWKNYPEIKKVHRLPWKCPAPFPLESELLDRIEGALEIINSKEEWKRSYRDTFTRY